VSIRRKFIAPIILALAATGSIIAPIAVTAASAAPVTAAAPAIHYWG